MANSFITAAQIVEASNLLLQREIVLPRLVWRDFAGRQNFVNALNDTVTLRVPAVLDARTRTLRSSNALVADDLAQSSVTVQLDTHVYSLLNITDEELTLNIVDFARDVLAPQIRAVVEGLEDVVATEMQGATASLPSATQHIAYAEASDDAFDVLVDARAALNNLNVPRSNRVVVVGSNVEAALLKTEKFHKVNEAGTTDALREATLERVAGFTIVGSNAVDPDFAMAFHQQAFALAVIPPALPAGATKKASTTVNGLGLRYIQDYNPTNSTGPVDRSLVDSFAGAASVNDGAGDSNPRAVYINFTGA